MTAVLNAGQQGTPLLVFSEHDFSQWLNQQPADIQNWLNAVNFKKGLQLLPNDDGRLSNALFVSKDLTDFFACGDLPNLLPSGDYFVQNTQDTDSLTRIAFAWGVGAYRFTRYKKSEKTPAQLYIADATALANAQKLVAATCLARDLINAPAADMMPADLAKVAETLASQFGATVEQVIGDDLVTQNYPMIHAVGRASDHQPRLIDLRWGNKNHPKLTLVGKGICFDSGGLDIKPSSGMRQMKKDMGGAANVLGLAQLIMAKGLPVNLRVLIPAAENAISSNSFRPGDVISTRKGTTVEIDNTDAEGRLVLCDAITEAVSEKPELIIDFATLTGACRVALGTDLPGFFTNQQAIANELMLSAQKTSDPVWQLPLHQLYKEGLNSEIADLANSAPTGFGGAITAALYLEHFVEDIPWVHFDLMAWNLQARPGKPIGGEAMGIRTVFEYLQKRYAKD